MDKSRESYLKLILGAEYVSGIVKFFEINSPFGGGWDGVG